MTADNQPRIAAVATANPPYRFTQEEVLRLLGYQRPLVREIFLNSDIDTRYLHVDPAAAAARPEDEDLDTLHRRYQEGAVLIARQAAEPGLEKAGLTRADVDCILVCSCTGYLCPDLATILVKEMGLPARVQRGSLLGLGCAGALPTPQRAYDHARAYPEHNVLAVAVEICSAAYYLDDTIETLVGNATCAAGAAAAFVTGRSDSGPPVGRSPSLGVGPRLAGFASVVDPSCQRSVGLRAR